MATTPGAVFNEVLQVAVDIDQFTQGLAQLESAYEDFVDRINAKGFGAGNVLSVGAFAAVSETLDELKTHFEAFDTELSHSFDSLENIFSKAAAGIEATSQKLVDAQAQAAKLSTQTGGGGGANANGGVNFQPQVGFVQQFAQGIQAATTNLGGTAASLLAINVLWGAINLAVEAFTALVEAPFKFLETGITYLSQLQEKAADLQGPILASVKFSDDLKTNFQIAGQQATIVAQEFEDFANKTGIAATQLDNALKAVLDSGGAKLTGGLSGAVQLTEEFALAMRAAGVSVDGARRIISEIPKALEGTLSPSSKLLETLHQTPEQFKAMVEEAQKYSNLQDLLAERLKPYIGVLDQAEGRLTVLREELGKIFERTAGVAAQPIFDALIAGAQKLKELYEENKGTIDALVSSFGNLVAAVFNVVTSTLTWLGHILNIGKAFNVIIITAQIIAEALTTILNGVTAIFNVFTKMIELVKDPKSYTAPGEFFKNLFDYATEQAKKFYDSFIDGGKRVQAAIDNTSAGAGGILDGDPTHGTRNLDAAKEASAALKTLEQDYQKDLANTKAYYQDDIDKAKELASAREISTQTATDKIKEALSEEQSAVLGLTKHYEDLAAATGAKGTDAFLTQLQKTATDLERTIGKQSTAATTAQNRDNLAVQKSYFDASEQLATVHARALLAIAKQGDAAGNKDEVAILEQERAIEQQEFEAKEAILEKEYIAAGANVLAQTEVVNKLNALDEAHRDFLLKNSNDRTQAVYKEIEAAKQLALSVAESQQRLDQARAQGSNVAGEAAQLKIKTVLDQQALSLAIQNTVLAEIALKDAERLGNTQAILKAQIALNDAQVKQQGAQNTVNNDNPSTIALKNSGIPVAIQDLVQDLKDGGGELKAAFGDINTAMQTVAQSFEQGVKLIGNVINAVQNGEKSGGTLGGIGGGLSAVSGIVTAINPIAGAVVGGIGALFSTLGGLFTAEAKRIADQVQKQIAQTLNDYSNQTISLIQTIGQVTAERASLIAQESGKKGGQDQLDKLLPGIDQQLAQLKLQAQQTITTFEQQLAVLNLQSAALGTALTTWQQINDQVKAYLGAGGDAAKAAQFLSDQLKQIQTTNQANLDQGEQTAITDAISLNSLLQKKVDLQKSYNQQLFAASTQDAVERRADPAIAIAQNLATQKTAFQQQLADLNNQIDLTTQKLSLEKTIFQIASDTATLNKQSNALTIAALQTQIQQFKDMQTLVKSIFQNPNGTFGSNNPIFGGSGGGATVIQVNVSAGGAANGTQLGTDIGTALVNRLRSGLQPAFATR